MAILTKFRKKNNHRNENSNLDTIQKNINFNHSPLPDLLICEPKFYEEVEEIGFKLKEKNALIINIHMLENNESFRLIDFLSGIVFALDGEIERISKTIILFSPCKITRSLSNNAIEKIKSIDNFLY